MRRYDDRTVRVGEHVSVKVPNRCQQAAPKNEPEMTTCAQCHRALMKGHEDANGLCVFCNGTEQAPPIPGYHAPTEATATEIGHALFGVGVAPKSKQPAKKTPCEYCHEPTTNGRHCASPVCRAARSDPDELRAAKNARWQPMEGPPVHIRMMEGAHLLNVLRLIVGNTNSRVRADVIREAHYRGYLDPNRPRLGPKLEKTPKAWTEEHIYRLSELAGFDVRPGLTVVGAAVVDQAVSIEEQLQAPKLPQRVLAFDTSAPEIAPYDPTAIGRRKIKVK